MEKKEFSKNGAWEDLLEVFSEAGINTDGVELDEKDNLLDIFHKIGISIDKIVICDDARTFDNHDMERMEEEGRVIDIIDLGEKGDSF